MMMMINHHWQNSTFYVTVFLIRFCQIASGFHFFGFRNNNLFTEQGRQPYTLIMSLSDRVAQLSPRHGVSFASPPTTRRATVELF
jgi:hypothetical protein